MSKQQQQALDARLRQSRFDAAADVATLRDSFEAFAQQVPRAAGASDT